jgi:PPOX class probable F420-dependent enzyme
MSLPELGEPKYLLLTTFRTDGTPVPTPVWCVRDDSGLRVITQADSGKVRRIRANRDVLVGPCDARGRPKGPQLMRRSRRRMERGGAGMAAIAISDGGLSADARP